MQNEQTGITIVSILFFFFWLSNLYISCVVIVRLIIENCYRTRYFLYIVNYFHGKKIRWYIIYVHRDIVEKLNTFSTHRALSYEIQVVWTQLNIYSWLLKDSSDGFLLEKRSILARQRELKRKWRCTAYVQKVFCLVVIGQRSTLRVPFRRPFYTLNI